jgi:hypothetical protein
MLSTGSRLYITWVAKCNEYGIWWIGGVRIDIDIDIVIDFFILHTVRDADELHHQNSK